MKEKNKSNGATSACDLRATTEGKSLIKSSCSKTADKCPMSENNGNRLKCEIQDTESTACSCSGSTEVGGQYNMKQIQSYPPMEACSLTIGVTDKSNNTHKTGCLHDKKNIAKDGSDTGSDSDRDTSDSNSGSESDGRSDSDKSDIGHGNDDDDPKHNTVKRRKHKRKVKPKSEHRVKGQSNMLQSYPMEACSSSIGVTDKSNNTHNTGSLHDKKNIAKDGSDTGSDSDTDDSTSGCESDGGSDNSDTGHDTKDDDSDSDSETGRHELKHKTVKRRKHKRKVKPKSEHTNSFDGKENDVTSKIQKSSFDVKENDVTSENQADIIEAYIEPVINFNVKSFRREHSRIELKPVDEDGDLIVDPTNDKAVHMHRKHSKSDEDNADGDQPVGEADTDEISISSDSDDENELVESKKCQLKICRNSLFCRIDSRTSKHNGKKLIRHYVTKEDECTDITGKTGLKPLDELIRVNGQLLKDKKQKKVRRIFKNIKLNKLTNEVNIDLHIRRWIASERPMNEQKWVMVKVITISIVLEPDLKPPPCKWKWLQRKIGASIVDVMKFTVTDSQLKTDETVELSSGCITIEKTSSVKRCKLKCGLRYVSDVPLPDNYVGVSVITERRPCIFYRERFSGVNTTPKPVFNDYIFCMRIRLNDPNGFLFLSSVIGGDVNTDVSRDVKFVNGNDDFGSIKREHNIDERCFIGYHLGSDVFLASLIYREWFIAYDKEKDRLYMKLIPIHVQRTYARGNTALGYYEADRMFANCRFEFFDFGNFYQRLKQSVKPYLCGVTH